MGQRVAVYYCYQHEFAQYHMVPAITVIIDFAHTQLRSANAIYVMQMQSKLMICVSLWTEFLKPFSL
jgi:hypothetical protein